MKEEQLQEAIQEQQELRFRNLQVRVCSCARVCVCACLWSLTSAHSAANPRLTSQVSVARNAVENGDH